MASTWSDFVAEHGSEQPEEQWLEGEGVIPSQEVDDVLKVVLASVVNHGGEATTSEVKANTGYNNQKILYRFKKLEKYGLADVTQQEAAKQGIPPKVCKVTSKGIFAVEERGLAGSDVFDHEVSRADEIRVSVDQLEQFQRDLAHLENRLNAASSPAVKEGSQDTDGSLEDRVDELESELERVKVYLGSITMGLNEEMGLDAREYADEAARVRASIEE